MSEKFPNQRQSDGTAAPEPEPKKRLIGGCHARLVRLFFVSVIGVGSLANTLQGVEVGADRVSWVSDDVTNVLCPDGAEGFGRNSELLPVEITPNLDEQPVKLPDALQVSLPRVLGLPVVGALDVGSPRMDKSSEIAPSGLGLTTGGANRGDDSPSGSSGEERADYWKCIAIHSLVGGLGGVCGSFLVLLFQGYYSAER